MPCTWNKFKQLHHILTNRNINIELQMQLLDLIITSTILYGLETYSMTSTLQKQLDIVQRKMLRRMIGWIACQDDSYYDIGHKMKCRFNQCLDLYEMQKRSQNLQNRKHNMLQSFETWPEWTRLAFKWDPQKTFESAKRSCGRPPMRWNDC